METKNLTYPSKAEALVSLSSSNDDIVRNALKYYFKQLLEGKACIFSIEELEVFKFSQSILIKLLCSNDEYIGKFVELSKGMENLPLLDVVDAPYAGYEAGLLFGFRKYPDFYVEAKKLIPKLVTSFSKKNIEDLCNTVYNDILKSGSSKLDVDIIKALMENDKSLNISMLYAIIEKFKIEPSAIHKKGYDEYLSKKEMKDKNKEITPKK